jgi:hypothetical protein
VLAGVQEALRRSTGAAVLDVYRESLALVETAEDCIYQRAMTAVRRVGEPDFEFIECVSGVGRSSSR